MDVYVIAIIALIGAGTLFGVFRNMKEGFGPFNLKVLGIVLVATFASILGATDGSSVTAAMGILGAIAGYLFGSKDQPN